MTESKAHLASAPKAPTREFRRGQKLTTEIRKLEVGQAVKVKYVGQTEREWHDRAADETRLLKTHIFEDLLSPGVRFGMFEDAGLKNAIDNALVKEGTLLEIVKREKATLANGRTCNQYDVYSLE